MPICKMDDITKLEPLFEMALATPHYMTQCSPQRRLEDPKRNGFDVSCFTDVEINKLISDYNSDVREYRRIPLDISFQQKRQQLLQHKGCDSDACLLDNIKHIDDVNNALKPKGHLKWLSNVDIDDVMHQFEKIFPNFKFIEAVSCDYYQVYPHLFPHDVRKYMDVAWIFNTDRTFQAGQHWVALYVNNVKRTVEYFDSVGKEPNKYIRQFIAKYFGDYSYSWSRIKHQKENNECGIYSVFWVLARLHGVTITERITDEQMHYFRAAVFR